MTQQPKMNFLQGFLNYVFSHKSDKVITDLILNADKCIAYECSMYYIWPGSDFDIGESIWIALCSMFGVCDDTYKIEHCFIPVDKVQDVREFLVKNYRLHVIARKKL